MKEIREKCKNCDGKGVVPVCYGYNSTAHRADEISHYETCKVCNGRKYTDEIVGFIIEPDEKQ